MGKYNQMFYTNVISSIVALVCMCIVGTVSSAWEFTKQHAPELVYDVAIMSSANVAAQWLIHAMVMDYGATCFGATLNIRIIVSVVMSYIFFHNPISTTQIATLAIIGTVLMLRSCIGFIQIFEHEAGEMEPLV